MEPKYKKPLPGGYDAEQEYAEADFDDNEEDYEDVCTDESPAAPEVIDDSYECKCGGSRSESGAYRGGQGEGHLLV